MEDRHNYGVAISSSGEYQTVDTSSGPGVKDDYSRLRSEPFTFLVAPHSYVDKFLGIDLLAGEDYIEHRKQKMFSVGTIKALILRYHGVQEPTRKPTWAEPTSKEDSDWFD